MRTHTGKLRFVNCTRGNANTVLSCCDGKGDLMKATTTRILLSAATLALLTSSSAMALPDQEVRWEGFVGNIRTGATGKVGSGTGAVNAAGAPWVATGGNARVDLGSGELRFRIAGLVLADTNAVGTTANIPTVVGTLVCDTDGSAGGGNSVLVSTPQVPLTPRGEADFNGSLGPLPIACGDEPDIAFLVRATTGVYFAAGIVRVP
jgi:hypothetical protein